MWKLRLCGVGVLMCVGTVVLVIVTLALAVVRMYGGVIGRFRVWTYGYLGVRLLCGVRL